MSDDLIELLYKVTEGDSDALEKSQMEEVTEGRPFSVNLSSRDLQAEHYRTSMVKACCEILGLGTMAQVCQKQIDILNVCCHKFHNITLKPITLDPQDYADTMQHLVFELSQKLVPLAKKFSVAAAETALQPPSLPATDEPQPDTSGKGTGLEEARPLTSSASQPPFDSTQEPGPFSPNGAATEVSLSSGLEEARPSTSSASQPPFDSTQEPGPFSPNRAATEVSISSGLEEARPSTSSGSTHPQDSAEPAPLCPKKSSRKQVSPKTSSGKQVHYKESKCP